MQQLGIGDQVVTFTQSDFGRTLTSNGDGTDHAWGGIQIVTGGAVTGGRVFGEYPLLRLGARRGADRADDVGGGRFIPTLSSDQYAATLAIWFGVAEADLRTIAPSIDNFAARNLGFPSLSLRLGARIRARASWRGNWRPIRIGCVLCDSWQRAPIAQISHRSEHLKVRVQLTR